MDIIQENNDYCIVKQITEDSEKNFQLIFRKVFYQLQTAIKDLLSNLKNDNLVLLENIEEKHETITKFISYCLRLLNLGKIEHEKNQHQI